MHAHTQTQRYTGIQKHQSPLGYAWACVWSHTSLWLWFLPCVKCQNTVRMGQHWAQYCNMRLGLTNLQQEQRKGTAPRARQLSLCGRVARVLPASPCHPPPCQARVRGGEHNGVLPSLIHPTSHDPCLTASWATVLLMVETVEGRKNIRRISSVQYRPFESLLLQYTLTKIESHFISIQQQQQQQQTPQQFPGLLYR